MRLAIFGCGGMGREAMDIARRATKSRRRYNAMVFVTDGDETSVDGMTVIRPSQLNAGDELCIAVGDGTARRILAQRFNDVPLATLIASTAIVSPHAIIAEGSIICDYSVINNGVRIGRNFIGNVFVQVSHDSIIGDYVTFSPRVTCNGWVDIADDVFVGAGAIIRNGNPDRRLKVGQGAMLGMGSLVLGDVPDRARVIHKRTT